MNLFDLAGLIGGIATLCSAVFYVPAILRRQIHPHLFTWLIWSLVLSIGAAAQFAGGAGWGAAATAGSALVCIIIAVLSVKYGEKDIHPSDWVALVGALATIPLWIATDNPLGAVILVTLIDALGYWPTLRKTWIKPWDEVVSIYAISGVGYALALVAIRDWTWVTALYPAVLLCLDFALTGVALVRRRLYTRA